MKFKFWSMIAILMVGLLLTPTVGRAQNLLASASLDVSSVTTGDAVELTITVEGTTLANEPAIKNVDGLDISSLGRSSNVNFVNGKYFATITYSYEIIALKPGSYTLGPFEMKVKNEKLTANAVTLQVNGAVNQQNSALPAGVESSPLGDKLFMEMELGKSRLFLGEKTPVKIRLYFSEISIDEITPPVINQPEFVLDQTNKYIERATKINGRSYRVVEFPGKITPVKSGSFTLGPARLKCIVMINQQVDDGFFSRVKRYQLELKSNRIKVNALPIPTTGKPANFSGGIGQFKIQVTGQPTEVLQGEPITLKLTVTGNGNLQTVSSPYLANSNGLKVYDAQKKNTGKGETGQINFEQVVIPIDPKVKQIGPFKFSYFDPYQGSYRQATASALSVNVKPNPNFKTVQFSDTEATDENYGKDLVFIKERLGTVKHREEQLIYQNWFWWLQLLPLLGLIIALGYRSYHKMLHSDSPKSRAIRASSWAVRQMAKVKTELTEKPKDALEELHLIIREYLGKKYELNTAGMTGSVVEQIEGFGVNTETLGEIKAFFDRYDYYQFTGSKIGVTEVEQLWEKVNRIIKNIDQIENYTQKVGKAPERRGQNGKF